MAKNTVKKRRKASAAAQPRYERAQRVGKLSVFDAMLVVELKTDAHRARDQRRTARAKFEQLQAQGYRGGYSAVTDFIRVCSRMAARTARRRLCR